MDSRRGRWAGLRPYSGGGACDFVIHTLELVDRPEVREDLVQESLRHTFADVANCRNTSRRPIDDAAETRSGPPRPRLPVSEASSGAVRSKRSKQNIAGATQRVEMALLQRERITVSTPQVINQMTTRIKTHWISHEDGTQTVDVPSTSSQLKTLPRADRSWIPGRPALAEMNEAVEDYVQYLVTRPILPDKAKAGEFAGKACDGLFAPNATAKTRPAEAANTAPKKAAEPVTERRPHTATGFREFGEWREGGAKSASPTPSAKASCSTKTSAEELPWQYPIPQRQNGSNKQKVSSIRRPPRCTLP